MKPTPVLRIVAVVAVLLVLLLAMATLANAQPVQLTDDRGAPCAWRSRRSASSACCLR